MPIAADGDLVHRLFASASKIRAREHAKVASTLQQEHIASRWRQRVADMPAGADRHLLQILWPRDHITEAGPR